jgi:hypothetical protein
MGIGAPELLVLLVLWVGVVAGAFVGLYWLIRLAVRHGVTDANRQVHGWGVSHEGPPRV